MAGYWLGKYQEAVQFRSLSDFAIYLLLGFFQDKVFQSLESHIWSRSLDDTDDVHIIHNAIDIVPAM